MKQFLRFITCALFFLTFSLNSCSPDAISSATIVTFPEEGLLGQEITIQLEGMTINNMQVFFDLEEAQIYYVSESEIRVIVPRTITTNTPILKIIDLTTNETILSETFSLKAPVISGYSTNEVTFNEVFSIYGENFDVVSDDIKVYVNNEIAQIVSTNYNTVQIIIPTAIVDANLQIKVSAQRQEVNSGVGLQLKNPVITGIETQTAWITSQLVVNCENFNPDYQHGEVFVNGVSCYFHFYNDKLSIDTPPGPFTDFNITNIAYKTAGLTANYTTSVPIANDAIMVDNSTIINGSYTIFTHNNKAYNLAPLSSSFNGTVDYALFEFSPLTEKWTQLSVFQYNGRIADAVYDGDDTLYLYKYLPGSDSYVLTKLNMDTFIENTLTLPYNKIIAPILFAYQDNLYVLSGINNTNGFVSTRTEKYRYSEISNAWTTLPSSAFSEMPLVSTQGSGKCHYMHYRNDIYLSYGINFKTYKITPGLSVSDYNYNFSFGYQNQIIGRYGNGTSETLYNLNTNAALNVQNNIFGFGNTFFMLNNEIYFIKNSWTEYYPNTFYTQKLRKTILNAIL